MALGAALSALTLAGWSTTAAGTAAATTYVGAVPGTDALIALVVSGDEAVGYLCDSASIASPLAGGREGSGYVLSAPGSYGYSFGAGAPVAGPSFRANGRWASGWVTIAGETHRFVATKAAAPAGYYRARTDAFAAHWVVAPDGSQRGAVIDRTSSGLISGGPIRIEVTTNLTITLGGQRTTASRV